MTSDPVITRIIQRDVEAKQRSRGSTAKRDDEELDVPLESDDKPPDADERHQTSYGRDRSLASEEEPYLSDHKSSGEDDTEKAYSLSDTSAHCQVRGQLALVSSARA